MMVKKVQGTHATVLKCILVSFLYPWMFFLLVSVRTYTYRTASVCCTVVQMKRSVYLYEACSGITMVINWKKIWIRYQRPVNVRTIRDTIWVAWKILCFTLYALSKCCIIDITLFCHHQISIFDEQKLKKKIQENNKKRHYIRILQPEQHTQG